MILRRADQILLCHRSPERRWYPDVWDFPGGHVEPGERPGDALRREVAEELGATLDGVDGEPVLRRADPRTGLDLTVWASRQWRGPVANLQPAEHDLIGWFGSGQLAALTFADPSYLPLLQHLLTTGQDVLRGNSEENAALPRTTINYMSHPLSVRLNDATLDRLGARARRIHLPPRTLAQRYVEEGLRMDEHPLVRFADGPSGRRARLLGTGKDVWEVVEVVRDNGGDSAESARYLEIPLGLVQAAIAYYGAYTAEIDQEIEANEQETTEAHAAYLAGQAALRR